MAAAVAGTQGRRDNLLLAGWTAAAVINIQSGFPIGLAQSDNLGLLGNLQRPNVVSGADAATSGSLADRLASATIPRRRGSIRPAFTAAAAGTWGNAPRLVTDVRTPRLVNTDLSVSKTSASATAARTAQIKLEVINLFNRVRRTVLRQSRPAPRRSVRSIRSPDSCG